MTPQTRAPLIPSPWWSSNWARSIIGVAVPIAYIFLLHEFSFLSSDVVRGDETAGAAIIGVSVWGIVTMVGFGLFGFLVTLHFPNGRPVIPSWSLVCLMTVVLVGLLLVIGLNQSPSGVPAAASPPHDSSLAGSLSVRRWLPYLFMPVTLLIGINALLQRLSPRTSSGIWKWAGTAIGVLPFLGTTILLIIRLAFNVVG